MNRDASPTSRAGDRKSTAQGENQRRSRATQQRRTADAQGLVIEIERVSHALGVQNVAGLERQQKDDPVEKRAADAAQPAEVSSMKHRSRTQGFEYDTAATLKVARFRAARAIAS